MTKSSRLLIVGTLPNTAGLGGVSIHVQRTLDWLNMKNFDFTFFDYKVGSLLSIVKLIRKHEIIHVHVSNVMYKLYILFVSKFFRKKTIFTKHGNLGNLSSFQNYIDFFVIKHCDIPIVLNQKSYLKSIDLNRNTILLNAFLPPVTSESLPSSLNTIIKSQHDSRHKVFVTNASKRVFDSKTKEEIYGIHFLLSFFREKLNYTLIVLDPSGEYTKVVGPHPSKNIYIYSQSISFFSLIKVSDVVIRNTSQDGDSLSVREALFLNKSVCASNCVDRPHGVILFKYNDLESFSLAIKDSLNVSCKTQEKQMPIDLLINIYNKL